MAKQNAQMTELKNDFNKFIYVLWGYLNLPNPTRIQMDIAKYLVNAPDRFILQAFRGVGKSFITCGYVCWQLWRDPQVKIMIVSSSKDRADANATFIRQIIGLVPFLNHLEPDTKTQRDSRLIFDVRPAKPDASPSVKSIGVSGQLTGSRADIIIADDKL
ncbi:phage terminase large subunit [Tatumella sp. JGM82]|uniref:phage terminase large subunit n=1 Tax=Tatumella sp. JGM82 TaxID=2799795 RepID=UPI001BAEF6E2|nr:phage terminase large subunit [Tatumella sp. JGM82]MBS0878869.1 phage terminase large subunit [Tatumella sp. JGM82]